MKALYSRLLLYLLEDTNQQIMFNFLIIGGSKELSQESE